MKRLVTLKRGVWAIALLIAVGLTGCANTSTAGTVFPDEPVPALEILSPRSIEPIVGIEFPKKLVAGRSAQFNQPAKEIECKWQIIGGTLPAGLKLNPNGEFSGEATTLGEKGTFLVQASTSTQSVAVNFSFTVKDTAWTFPGKINVSNFYPGARAEYVIKAHNDDSIMSEQKKVITEPSDVPDAEGRITADIPLRQLLHNGDTGNVRPIKSSNPADRLQVLSYNAEIQAIKVAGFMPLSERLIIVEYASDSLFSVFYETVDWDVASLVTITEPQFLLAPNETKEVLVILEMPKNYRAAPKQFEFRVGTGRIVSAGSDRMDVAAVNAVRWLVEMR
jgi:hypothetical protein